jgi:hypothetical protein
MDSEDYAYLKTLLEYPEETATAEYKSAIAFEEKDEFSAKLVKHILGQANAGGGYVIIGFKENAERRLTADPGMTPQTCGSYETTRLSQFVDKYLASGQRIDLQVLKVESQGVTYPIISVGSFDEVPFFSGRDLSTRDGKPILREGAVYVRDKAAKTVTMAGPSQFKALLKVAVSQRQSDVLGQFRSLLADMGLSLPSSTAGVPDTTEQEAFEEWVKAKRTKALSEWKKSEGQDD